MAANAGPVAFPTLSFAFEVPAAAVRKDERTGFADGRQIPEKHREIVLCHGWQAAGCSLAGNFLAAVDDNIAETGKSGPTKKWCSVGTGIDDHSTANAVVLFAEMMNRDFSCHGAQPLR